MVEVLYANGQELREVASRWLIVTASCRITRWNASVETVVLHRGSRDWLRERRPCYDRTNRRPLFLLGVVTSAAKPMAMVTTDGHLVLFASQSQMLTVESSA